MTVLYTHLDESCGLHRLCCRHEQPPMVNRAVPACCSKEQQITATAASLVRLLLLGRSRPPLSLFLHTDKHRVAETHTQSKHIHTWHGMANRYVSLMTLSYAFLCHAVHHARRLRIVQKQAYYAILWAIP